MLRELVHAQSLDTMQPQYDFISADCRVIKASKPCQCQSAKCAAKSLLAEVFRAEF